MTFIS